jgi:hypothetical protein
MGKPAQDLPRAGSTPAGSTPGSLSIQPTPQPTTPTATDRLSDTVKTVLTTAAKGAPIPDREALRAALITAGIPGDTLEVSISRTPTGLEVDAIEAAARTGGDCVIGQIRGGSVAVAVLPVLAGGKCFVGDSR